MKRESKRNAVIQVATKFFVKLGDSLCDAKTILPWFLSSLNAPAFFLGMLVPVRESGSLIPQLYFGSLIKRHALSKWFFVFGCVGQALAVLLMACIAIYAWGGLQTPESQKLNGMYAGFGVIICLIIFSLARCLCSISSKDVLGKTIPSKTRGRVVGWGASAAGIVTFLVGLSLVFGDRLAAVFAGSLSINVLLVILFASVGCWLLAALTFAFILEDKGEKDSKPALQQLKKGVHLIKDDATFRQFIVTRTLLMSSGLAAPFFVMLASNSSADLARNLGLFVIVNGLASVLSANFWGAMADKSSRMVLIVVAALTACLCVLGSLLQSLTLAPKNLAYLAIFLFFLLAIVHQGVRLGRKTYVVNVADGNQRTEYVSVGNSIIGVCLLFVGFASALISQISVPLVFAFFALGAFLAFLSALRLPETDHSQ